MFPALRFPASVRVTLRDDDTAEVATSGADPGTGLLTVLSLVGAESLDIPPARVTPLLGDSALPPGGMSGGSTGTASAGSAIMIAAAQVIEDLQGLASSPGAPFDGMEVSYADGRVLADGRTVTFGELLRAMSRSSISAIGSSSPGEELTKHSFSSFGAQFCEVRVHRWTREARVSRMLGVFDAGRIINAKTARSQIIGGMIWGVSAALHEGLEIEPNGRLANGDLDRHGGHGGGGRQRHLQRHRHPGPAHPDHDRGSSGLGRLGASSACAAAQPPWREIRWSHSYSIGCVTCTVADMMDAVVVGLPGAAQDRLPADVPGARPGRPGPYLLGPCPHRPRQCAPGRPTPTPTAPRCTPPPRQPPPAATRHRVLNPC